MPNETEWIPEQRVAEQLGVHRDRLRELRPPTTRRDGKLVLWLRSAAEALAEKIGLKTQLDEKNTPQAEDRSEEVTVISAPGIGGFHFPNPNMIRVQRKCGENVLVRVVSSAKYLPRLRNGQPMTLKARPSVAGNWWVPTGREPRYPGFW